MLPAKHPSDYDWPRVQSATPVPPARLSFLAIVGSTRALTLRECRLASALATLWTRDGGYLSDVPTVSELVYAARDRLQARTENRALIREAARENPATIPGVGTFWRQSFRHCEECGKLYAVEDSEENGTCSKACTDNMRAGDRGERASLRAYYRNLDAVTR
jgi:hypothetical protein